VLSGARWGHLHLRASSPERSAKFYASALGVSLTQRIGANACFLAADGYHHHLGLNSWGGVRQPQPAGALGLVEATFAKSRTAGESHIRDPDQIALHIVSKE
jgi:catechol 2,3-dioxygenase